MSAYDPKQTHAPLSTQSGRFSRRSASEHCRRSVFRLATSQTRALTLLVTDHARASALRRLVFQRHKGENDRAQNAFVTPLPLEGAAELDLGGAINEVRSETG